MNSKVLISALVVITIIIFGYYLYSNLNQGAKNAPLTLYNNTNPSVTSSTTYPIVPNTKNVRSVVLVYDFYGRVTKIEQGTTGVRFTLDTSDSSTPEFVTGNYTSFFVVNGSSAAPKTANITDVKVGSNVDLSMVYYPNAKNWELRGVSIQETATVSASPSPSASPK